MLENNKKILIIFCIFSIIVGGVFCFWYFSNFKNINSEKEVFELDSQIAIDNNSYNSNTGYNNNNANNKTGNANKSNEKGNEDDDYIFVHIIGEVHNNGLVKLHARCKNCRCNRFCRWCN